MVKLWPENCEVLIMFIIFNAVLLLQSGVKIRKATLNQFIEYKHPNCWISNKLELHMFSHDQRCRNCPPGGPWSAL